jgi:uncharacterized protein YndB with AHSA1/START domain
MAKVVVDHRFSAPPARVFAHLAEHENLAAVFGARVERLRDGDDGQRNSAGSARRLKIGPLPDFDETVTEYVPDELIRYRITRGSPVRDHRGEMRFQADGPGTWLHYEIAFGAVVPGLDRLIAAMLERNMVNGLRAVDDRLIAT